MNFRFLIRSCCATIALCAAFMADISSRKVLAAEIQIQLNETAVVHSDRVLLSSVATVSCSDPVRAKEVEAVELPRVLLALFDAEG